MQEFDSLTEVGSESLFKLELMPTRPYTKDTQTPFDLTIEMNRDLAVIQRSGYSITDALSDTGGILSIFSTLLAVLMGLFNYQRFDTYMASSFSD